MNMIHGPGSYAAPPGATFDRAPRGRGSRSRLTAIVWAAAFAPMLLSGSGSANEMVGSAPMASPPEQSETVEAGTGGLSQETGTASRSRLTNDEIETVLPHLIRSSEARHLAAALAFLIRQGDFPAAKRLLEGAVEASSFAVLASDWLHEPRLLAMLHDHGISGADPSSHPDLTAQVSELKTALEQERKRGEALAREHAGAAEKLASLEAAQGRSAEAAAAGERAQGGLGAGAQARRGSGARARRRRREAREPRGGAGRSAEAAAQVSELKAALEQERKRGEALAREHAALQATQVTRDRPETVYATASTPLPEETSRIRPPATPRSLALAPASADNPLLKRAAALMRSGDIVGARLLLERASEAEDVRAIVLLAETYDPRALSRLGVLGLRGDADKAEELYARARALENRQRLSRSQSAR